MREMSYKMAKPKRESRERTHVITTNMESRHKRGKQNQNPLHHSKLSHREMT